MTGGVEMEVRKLATGVILLGIIIIALGMFLTWMYSSSTATDGPNNDVTAWILLIPGSILICLGTGSRFLIAWRGTSDADGRSGRINSAFGVFIAALFIFGYLLNPLLSPIPTFHDSDIDSVPDYSDDYPFNASRQNYPWVSFGPQFALSSTENDWRVTLAGGCYDCWIDAVFVKILHWNNATGLEPIAILHLNSTSYISGVKFFNQGDLDVFDAGDFFAISQPYYTDGFRITLMAHYDSEFYTMAYYGHH